jgi:hypothetical protein
LDGKLKNDAATPVDPLDRDGRMLDNLARNSFEFGLGSYADFEAEWRVFLSKRTEADFQAWRDDRDWTAEGSAAFSIEASILPP